VLAVKEFYLLIASFQDGKLISKKSKIGITSHHHCKQTADFFFAKIATPRKTKRNKLLPAVSSPALSAESRHGDALPNSIVRTTKNANLGLQLWSTCDQP